MSPRKHVNDFRVAHGGNADARADALEGLLLTLPDRVDPQQRALPELELVGVSNPGTTTQQWYGRTFDPDGLFEHQPDKLTDPLPPEATSEANLPQSFMDAWTEALDVASADVESPLSTDWIVERACQLYDPVVLALEPHNHRFDELQTADTERGQVITSDPTVPRSADTDITPTDVDRSSKLGNLLEELLAGMETLDARTMCQVHIEPMLEVAVGNHACPTHPPRQLEESLRKSAQRFGFCARQFRVTIRVLALPQTNSTVHVHLTDLAHRLLATDIGNAVPVVYSERDESAHKREHIKRVVTGQGYHLTFPDQDPLPGTAAKTRLHVTTDRGKLLTLPDRKTCIKHGVTPDSLSRDSSAASLPADLRHELLTDGYTIGFDTAGLIELAPDTPPTRELHCAPDDTTRQTLLADTMQRRRNRDDGPLVVLDPTGTIASTYVNRHTITTLDDTPSDDTLYYIDVAADTPGVAPFNIRDEYRRDDTSKRTRGGAVYEKSVFIMQLERVLGDALGGADASNARRKAAKNYVIDTLTALCRGPAQIDTTTLAQLIAELNSHMPGPPHRSAASDDSDLHDAHAAADFLDTLTTHAPTDLLNTTATALDITALPDDAILVLDLSGYDTDLTKTLAVTTLTHKFGQQARRASPDDAHADDPVATLVIDHIETHGDCLPRLAGSTNPHADGTASLAFIAGYDPAAAPSDTPNRITRLDDGTLLTISTTTQDASHDYPAGLPPNLDRWLTNQTHADTTGLISIPPHSTPDDTRALTHADLATQNPTSPNLSDAGIRILGNAADRATQFTVTDPDHIDTDSDPLTTTTSTDTTTYKAFTTTDDTTTDDDTSDAATSDDTGDDTSTSPADDPAGQVELTAYDDATTDASTVAGINFEARDVPKCNTCDSVYHTRAAVIACHSLYDTPPAHSSHHTLSHTTPAITHLETTLENDALGNHFLTTIRNAPRDLDNRADDIVATIHGHLTDRSLDTPSELDSWALTALQAITAANHAALPDYPILTSPISLLDAALDRSDNTRSDLSPYLDKHSIAGRYRYFTLTDAATTIDALTTFTTPDHTDHPILDDTLETTITRAALAATLSAHADTAHVDAPHHDLGTHLTDTYNHAFVDAAAFTTDDTLTHVGIILDPATDPEHIADALRWAEQTTADITLTATNADTARTTLEHLNRHTDITLDRNHDDTPLSETRLKPAQLHPLFDTADPTITDLTTLSPLLNSLK